MSDYQSIKRLSFNQHALNVYFENGTENGSVCSEWIADLVFSMQHHIDSLEAQRDAARADARALAEWIQMERENWRTLEEMVTRTGKAILSTSIPKMASDMETVLREHGAKYLKEGDT